MSPKLVAGILGFIFVNQAIGLAIGRAIVPEGARLIGGGPIGLQASTYVYEPKDKKDELCFYNLITQDTCMKKTDIENLPLQIRYYNPALTGPV